MFYKTVSQLLHKLLSDLVQIIVYIFSSVVHM